MCLGTAASEHVHARHGYRSRCALVLSPNVRNVPSFAPPKPLLISVASHHCKQYSLELTRYVLMIVYVRRTSIFNKRKNYATISNEKKG